MSIFKTDFIQFGENLYEVVPPIPTEDDRGGIIASPKTDAETIEAKLGDDGKLYVGADAKGSAAAALSLANENTQTKIDELSEAVDGKLAGKANSKHNHNAREITVSSPFENTQNSILDVILEDFDVAISNKVDEGHIHNTDTIKYTGNSGNIIGNGDTLTKILQGYDQRMTSAESNILNHSHNASNVGFSAKNFSSTTADDVQSAIEHIDERIDIINDELSQSIEELANNKANTTHEHAIADVNGLQTKLDEKADSNHTHNQYAATSHKHFTADVTYDGFTGNYFESGDNLLNILETFDEAVYSKADASALAGKANATHGHDASEIAFDSSTKEITGDTVLEALENADFAISNMVTDIGNKANKVHKHVSSDITDLQTKLDTTLESSKDYTDEKVALLLNNSSAAVDSIMELASAMEENEEVVDALEQAIGNKADKTHGHTLSDITDYTVDTDLSTTSTNPVQNQAVTNWLSDNVKNYRFALDGNGSSLILTSDDVDVAASAPSGSAAIYSVNVFNTEYNFGTFWKNIEDIPSGSTTQEGIVKLTDSTSSTSTTTAATPNSVKQAYDLAASYRSEIDDLKERIAYIDSEDNEDVTDPGSEDFEIIIDSALSSTSTNPVQNKIVKAALDNKCDKSYIADIFMQLKTALENSNIDGAIAVLDNAILDMTTLA